MKVLSYEEIYNTAYCHLLVVGDPDAFRPKTSLVQKACRLTQSDKLKSVKLLSPNPVMKVWLKRELGA